MLIKPFIREFMVLYHKMFINHNGELIVFPKENEYFSLNDVETRLEFDFKIINWLSRPIAKGLSDKRANKLLDIVNTYLKTNFTKNQMGVIYCVLGNNCKPSLTMEFVNSNYDMNVIKKYCEGKECWRIEECYNNYREEK